MNMLEYNICPEWLTWELKLTVACWWIVGLPAQLVASGSQEPLIRAIHEQQSIDRTTPTFKFSKFPATRKDGITLSLSFQVEKRLAPYSTHIEDA